VQIAAMKLTPLTIPNANKNNNVMYDIVVCDDVML
jgi:hypothetical protein